MKSPDLLLLAKKFKNILQAKENMYGPDLAWFSSPAVSSQLLVSLQGTCRRCSGHGFRLGGSHGPPGRADVLWGLGTAEQGPETPVYHNPHFLGRRCCALSRSHCFQQIPSARVSVSPEPQTHPVASQLFQSLAPLTPCLPPGKGLSMRLQ